MHWILVALLACTACGRNLAVGSPCQSGADCKKGLFCLKDSFPDGYCSLECVDNGCFAGQVCAAVDSFTICLQGCQSQADCRTGYQCFAGGCTLPCTQNEHCGRGFQCVAGVCSPFDGAPLGAACNVDGDCANRLCFDKVCTLPCERDNICAADQTCALQVGFGTLASVCVQRRGTAAPGAGCAADSECDRGTCRYGICVELCAGGADCHGDPRVCSAIPLELESGDPASFKGCLPATGTLTFPEPSEVIGLPSNVQSMILFVEKQALNPLNTSVGVISLVDPMGALLYSQPASEAEFFNLTVRYSPDNAVSTMLVPNSPAVILQSGLYRFSVGANGGAPTTRVLLKLGSTPPLTGSVDLNFHLTDLAGACQNITVANAPSSLAQTLTQMRQVFTAAGITIANVNYLSTDAMNSIRIETENSSGDFFDMDEVLQTATAENTGPASLDVVILRDITTPMGGTSGVLGVSGGIPSAPFGGTPHTGVVAAIRTKCMDGNAVFGLVIAHELGHSMGLFHNVEQAGFVDALPDTGQDAENLMFWQEQSGSRLTAQQGAVMRLDAKVRP